MLKVRRYNFKCSSYILYCKLKMFQLSLIMYSAISNTTHTLSILKLILKYS